ncbi:transcriptional repressor [Collimonas sp. NPDC087041]|uniref:transcriptional repressor n=1 Tax=Collimonas sp. NPDC087041 TaxID=3363960 RepID=UPI00380B65BF
MELHTVASASVFDDHYQMAYLYCFDKQKNYCFSLSRFPSEEEIEIMVSDQINHKVTDLSVELRGGTISVCFDRITATKLDGEMNYQIHIQDFDDRKTVILAALQKIFEGKTGFRFFV